ncbi:DUF58 domain-containing protein [Persicobacter psychrovividus]|uniref:DUF58 domain-containing protein n=1 Tax=Persicobacter psychrovividus TaxID=387638 RepID=A0ABN6LGY3_9BACT|nr:hypothetical protein PEPS_46760 [Persicobacter psychrovividus]
MDIPKEVAVELIDLLRLEYSSTAFSLLPQQAVFSILAGQHASKLRGRGLDFAEVRQYVAGDDIRTIDWKVTARTKTAHTKVFHEEKERPALVVLDQSSSMFFASEGSMKSVVAAQIAAIAGFKVLKAGDRIGGLVFDDEQFESIKPKRNRQALLHFLEVVVRKNQQLINNTHASPPSGFINQALFKANNMITHDHVVLVISDLKHLDEKGQEYLIKMARHNDVIVALIYDPMEFALPELKIPFVDRFRMQIVAEDSESIRQKFNRSTQQQRTNQLEFLSKHGIPVMEFNTARSIDEQVKEIFGKRY